VERIYASPKQEWGHKLPFLPGLLEDIRQRGMVNPLIVLNHRGPGYHPYAVSTGVNRLWCARQLGWQTVPALVTGPEPQGIACDSVTWEQAKACFPDGQLYLSDTGNPRIAGYSNFLKGEFPDARGRKGVGQD
jgi:hypothetical protein